MIAAPTAAVVLAAGAGRRMGTVAKALLPHPEGGTYLAHITSGCRESGVSDPVVIVGPPHADAVRAHAEALGLRVLENPSPQRGMASSLEIGFGDLIASSPAAAAMLWPVDAPFAAISTISAIRAASGESVIVIPTHGGRGGHPASVGRDLWSALASCGELNEGARSVFRHNRGCQVRLEVTDPMVLVDINDSEDIDAAGLRR